MRRQARLAAVAALVGLLAVGCGGNPTPKALPSESASPSVSASASPTAPVPPSAERSRAGAVAFAGAFIETLNYSGATGDTKPLRALYMNLCTRCEAIADGIDRTYQGGGKIEGGSWHARAFKYYGIRNDVAFVDAFVDYDAQTLTKTAGATPEAFPASKKNLKAFNLRWTKNGWLTSALDPNR